VFLQSAEADLACAAANLFAENIRPGLVFLQSAEADLACAAANLFGENIRRDLSELAQDIGAIQIFNSTPPRYENFLSTHTLTT